MITFEHDGNAFTISYQGKPLIRHAPQAPCLVLGRGDVTYRMRYSNFKIKDHIRERRAAADWQAREVTDTRLVIAFADLAILSATVEDSAMWLRISPTAAGMSRMWLSLCASQDEHIYGCGEQFSVLDLRGRRVPIWIQEQGVGRGKDLITLLANVHSGSGGTWHTTYFAQPTFVSSANYSCHIDTTAFTELDFRARDRHILQIWDTRAGIRLDVCASAPEVITRLSAYLGRQPELPAWAYDGIWLGVQGGTEVIDRKLRTAKEHGVAVTALWAQDWEGIRMTSFGKQLMWNWRYDAGLYPDLPAYIQRLRAQGIRFLGYVNPMLVPEGDLYREARERGYLVKDDRGEVVHIYITSFPAGLVDLCNPAAYGWYKEIIQQNLIDLGMAGWMADFGEALPANALLASGERGETAHNAYPVHWARLNREAVEERGKLGEIVFFMRAGYSGSSRHALSYWAGDQLVNWSLDDGLATVIPAAISLGFCGIGHFHSDIGGYTAVAWIKRSKEVFQRWAELAAFTPIMRSHEGNRPDTCWQFDSDTDTLQHLARMTRIYVHLKEYHRALGKEHWEYGLPPIRHPYIHYESDTTLHRLAYQYLYGRDLLVAPVYKPRTRAMRVYLPDDAWIHCWTGASYGQGWHEVPAPMGQPPVFYRASSSYAQLFAGLQTIS